MSEKIRHVWIDFVLNEGIMPAPISRKIKFYPEEDKCVVVARILKYRDRYIASDNECCDIEDIVKKAFAVDEELVSWLKTVDSVLGMIINILTNPDLRQGSGDMLKSIMMYFIKSCPLVSESSKIKYLSFGVKREISIQEAFFNYVESLKGNKNTAYAYRSAINKISGIIEMDLWNNFQIENIESIIKLFSGDSDNQNAINLKKNNSHNNLSCAIKQYKKFIQECWGKNDNA